MKAFIALGVILTPPHRNGGLGGGGRDEEDGGWCKFVEFFQFFFKFVVFFQFSELRRHLLRCLTPAQGR